VGLPDGTGDDAYLAAVADVLPPVLQDFRPDLVLYDAGVDVHQADDLGRLCISDAGLMRRELLVLDTCLGLGVPVAGYVGGGYDADLDVLADRHICLHRAAAQMWQDHGL
jgi:acetoin utilization deacetylase AcuC-like enzyme